MKQVFFLLFAAAAFTACNDDKTTATDTKADQKVASASDVKMDYAYTIEHPDQWQWGSKENTKMVLASLKAYEMNNMDESIKAFADTVQLRFDGFEARLSKDSVKAMFTDSRNKYKSNKIDMHDFESVKSNDGKEEYVSLWYVEKWEDMKGNMDSASVMDDVKIKDGKIIEIDQKLRKFPKKKM